MIITTDIDVLTGPMWLFDMFNGYKNEKGTAELKPQIDPDGDPIIGMNVLNDPDWEFLDTVTSPEGETKQIREFLGIKKYKYELVEDLT